MRVVYDVGCAIYPEYPTTDSISFLIRELSPDVVYAFDPNVDASAGTVEQNGNLVRVTSLRCAAWTHDGHVRYVRRGLGGEIRNHGEGERVACVDLARLIVERDSGDELLLKIDAEGAEYPLLEHLIATGVAHRLSLAWVEWHDWDPEWTPRRRAAIERSLTCEYRIWTI